MSLTAESYKALTIDSVLVSQKDELLHLINAGYAGDQSNLRHVVASLSLLKDLWVSQSYGYKLNELCDRVIQTTTDELDKLAPQNKKDRRNLTQVRKQAEELKVPYELHIL